MSIWDYMKKAEPPTVPRSIEWDAEGRLVIAWEDGRTTRVRPRDLRAECPCASCVDEMTGRRVLDVAAIPENLKVESMHQVGNYALNFVFSDQHDTGIFDWKLLARIGRPTT